MTWYLVFASLTSYLGPMTLEECDHARASIFQSAVCREAQVYTTCPVAGYPNAGRACPDFYATPVNPK